MRSLTIALILLLTATAIPGDEPSVGGQATIQIMSQHLFPRPVFYATPVAELGFGDVVTILSESDDWFEVRTASGLTGWVHSTSVTGAVLSGGSVGSGSGEVTSDEIMLAGRGFNADMEQSYESSNPSLSFAAVDAMERIEVDPDDIYSFLVSGGLIQDEGAPAPEPVQPEQPPAQPGVRGGSQ